MSISSLLLRLFKLSKRTSLRAVVREQPRTGRLIVLPGGPADLETRCAVANLIFIDGARLRTLINEKSGADPYFGKRNNVEFSESVTRRVALRLGRVLAQKWGEPAPLITEALYFWLWIEFCTLLPIRRVAKRLAREAGAGTIAVHLPDLEMELREGWADSQLEPLMLAWALQNRGAAVVLVSVGVEPPSAIEIGASPVPSYAETASLSLQNRSSLIVADGIRGVESYILSGRKTALCLSAPIPCAPSPLRHLRYR